MALQRLLTVLFVAIVLGSLAEGHGRPPPQPRRTQSPLKRLSVLESRIDQCKGKFLCGLKSAFPFCEVECIDMANHCDGQRHCSNNYDEIGCPQTPAPPTTMAPTPPTTTQEPPSTMAPDCNMTPERCNHCQHLKQENGNYQSGEYWFNNGNGGLFRAYCIFNELANTGVMYIARAGRNVSIDFTRIFDSAAPESVVVKHQRVNRQQFDTIMSQISTQSSIPLSVQYDANVDYQNPINRDIMGPTIYLGFLPETIADVLASTQGYQTQAGDRTFSNCDGNGNSYLAFLFNEDNALPDGYYQTCCYYQLMRDWIDDADAATDYLPDDYFYQFEMHMGGCGGYAINGYNTLSDIWGASLGLQFDY